MVWLASCIRLAEGTSVGGEPKWNLLLLVPQAPQRPESHPWCGWLASEQQGSCRNGVLPSLSQNTAAQAPRAGPAEAIQSFHFLRLLTSGPSELPSLTCIICKASGVPCNPKVLRQTDNTECLAVTPVTQWTLLAFLGVTRRRKHALMRKLHAFFMQHGFLWST